MQHSDDHNVVADDPIDHDMNAKRMQPDGGREFVALARRSRVRGQEFKYALQSRVIIFGLSHAKFREATPKDTRDVCLGGLG